VSTVDINDIDLMPSTYMTNQRIHASVDDRLWVTLSPSHQSPSSLMVKSSASMVTELIPRWPPLTNPLQIFAFLTSLKNGNRYVIHSRASSTSWVHCRVPSPGSKEPSPTWSALGRALMFPTLLGP